MVPIGAIRFVKRTEEDIQLFSRSLVSNVDPDAHVKAYILAQLLYYKCTSAPIYALVVDPVDKSSKVIFWFEYLKQILFTNYKHILGN